MGIFFFLLLILGFFLEKSCFCPLKIWFLFLAKEKLFMVMFDTRLCLVLLTVCEKSFSSHSSVNNQLLCFILPLLWLCNLVSPARCLYTFDLFCLQLACIKFSRWSVKKELKDPHFFCTPLSSFFYGLLSHYIKVLSLSLSVWREVWVSPLLFLCPNKGGKS